MVRLFRKPSFALLTDPISQLSPLLQSLICTAEVMLAAAPDPTLFSALSPRHVWPQTSPHTSAQQMTILAIFELYQEIYRFLQRLLFCFSFPNASTPYTTSTRVRNNLPRLHSRIFLTDIEPGHSSLPPELLGVNAASTCLHCRHHHRQCHSCSTSRSGPTPVCLSPLPQLLAFSGKRFPTPPRPRSTLLLQCQNRTCITAGWLCCCTSCTREQKHPRTRHHAQLPGVLDISCLRLLEAVRREQQQPHCRPLRSSSRRDRLFLRLHFTEFSTALAK